MTEDEYTAHRSALCVAMLRLDTAHQQAECGKPERECREALHSARILEEIARMIRRAVLVGDQ